VWNRIPRGTSLDLLQKVLFDAGGNETLKGKGGFLMTRRPFATGRSFWGKEKPMKEKGIRKQVYPAHAFCQRETSAAGCFNQRQTLKGPRFDLKMPIVMKRGKLNRKLGGGKAFNMNATVQGKNRI